MTTPRKRQGKPMKQRVDAAKKKTAEQQAARHTTPVRSSAAPKRTDKPTKHAGKTAERTGKSAGHASRAAKRTSKDAKRTDRPDKHADKPVKRTADAQTKANTRAAKNAQGAKTQASRFQMSTRRRVGLSILCAVLLGLVILYPVGQTYYQNLRSEQKYQAVLDAVKARNAEIEESNKSLKTDEGIENQARKELGWTKKGDSAAVVTNADDDSTSTDLPDQVDADEVHAPQTWYYNVLDVVFFVQE